MPNGEFRMFHIATVPAETPEALVSSASPRRASPMLRLVDVVLGSAALVVTAPLMLMLAAMVQLSSPGPGFFRQVRLGRHGKPFTFLKLRSMVVDAPARGPHWTADDDPRVTPIGRFLRRTSLDELPQLWNVVRGEMSLVGPRPLVPAQRDALPADVFAMRHRVRPGITGLAQVRGRSQLETSRALYYDLSYAANPNARTYLFVLLETIRVVVGRRGVN